MDITEKDAGGAGTINEPALLRNARNYVLTYYAEIEPTTHQLDSLIELFEAPEDQLVQARVRVAEAWNNLGNYRG